LKAMVCEKYGPPEVLQLQDGNGHLLAQNLADFKAVQHWQHDSLDDQVWVQPVGGFYCGAAIPGRFHSIEYDHSLYFQGCQGRFLSR